MHHLVFLAFENFDFFFLTHLTLTSIIPWTWISKFHFSLRYLTLCCCFFCVITQPDLTGEYMSSLLQDWVLISLYYPQHLFLILLFDTWSSEIVSFWNHLNTSLHALFFYVLFLFTNYHKLPSLQPQITLAPHLPSGPWANDAWFRFLSLISFFFPY